MKHNPDISPKKTLMDWVSKMGQQANMPTAKPKDLSSNPGIHMVQGENRLPQVFFFQFIG